MRHSRFAMTLLICVLLPSLAAWASDAGRSDASELRLNHLQVIGSHNSYKLAIDPPLLRLLEQADRNASHLNYRHLPVTEQLDLGLRNLELDVFHDPEGGRYARPLGFMMVEKLELSPAPYDPHGLMHSPGMKVLHVQDIDFRSHHPTLRAYLAEMRAWSERHPAHVPVFVTLNTKDARIDLPGATVPLAFDETALNALDREILEILGMSRVIRPDDVRGDHESLEEAVLTSGWPRIDDVRGRFLFVLDEGGATREAYVRIHSALRGRVMFVPSEEGSPEAAFYIMNDPIEQQSEIVRRVKKGYLVRTRADANTREARRNDTSRFEAAQASGAQIITTDYYVPDERLDTGYQVRFAPGVYQRVNPVTFPEGVRADVQLEPPTAREAP